MYKDVKEQLDNLDKPIQLMIAGAFGSGKSTFLNAFIGEKLLNSSNRPETAVITKLTFGEEKELIAHYKDGRSSPLPIEWLSSLTSDRNGRGEDLQPYIHLIEIRLPIDLLKYIHMIDSPGINAKEEHDKISESYFDNIDVGFWLFYYESAGKVIENKFIGKLKERGIPVYGIINHIDDLMDVVDDEEEEQLFKSIKDVSQQVQIKSGNVFEDQIIGITASHALEARLNNNQEDLKLSNWGRVENLLEQVRDDTSIKYKKHYLKLEKLLKSIQFYIEEAEKNLPLNTYEGFVEEFCKHHMVDFYSNYQVKDDNIQAMNQFLHQWKAFGHIRSINSLTNLENLQEKLWRIQTISPELPPVYLYRFSEIQQSMENLIQHIRQWEKQMQDYEIRRNDVKKDWYALEKEWNHLADRKLIGVNRLKRFEEVNESHREQTRKLMEEYENLKQKKQDLIEQLESFEKHFKGFVDQLNTVYREAYDLMKDEMRIFLAGYQADYESLTEESVNAIYLFVSHIHELDAIVSPSFSNVELEVAATNEYQSAYEAFDELTSNNWMKRFTKKNKQDFLSFYEAVIPKDYLSWPRYISGHLDVNNLSLLNSTAYMPQEMKHFYPTRVRERINRNRKRVRSLFLIAVALLIMWQTNIVSYLFADFSEDARAGDEKSSSYSESLQEKVQTTQEEAVPTEEARPVYLSAEEVTNFLSEFRDNYFYALNEKNFNYVSPYLEPESRAYTSLMKYVEDLPENAFFSNEEIDVTSMSAVTNGTFHAETTERFTYEGGKGDLLHYERNKSYYIRVENDSLAIFRIEINNTQKAIEELRTVQLVTQEDVHRFMQNFIEEKISAVNTGSIGTLTEYYDQAGTAWPEMNDYIDRFTDRKEQLQIDPFYVQFIQQEDSRHYLVGVESSERVFSMDRVTQIKDKQTEYRLSVDQKGSIVLVDKIMEEVIYQEDIQQDTLEDKATSSATDVEADLELDSDTELHSESEVEPTPELNSGTEPNPEPELEPEQEPNADTEPTLESEIEPESISDEQEHPEATQQGQAESQQVADEE